MESPFQSFSCSLDEQKERWISTDLAGAPACSLKAASRTSTPVEGAAVDETIDLLDLILGRNGCLRGFNCACKKVLGIKAHDEVTAVSIKKAFRKRALECHPDRYLTAAEKKEAERKFKILCKAQDAMKRIVAHSG